ncbi:FtsK/SpoIIIE domain-containing protein [Streptomyces sp. HNM0574]|uniref:FtsK/SpoIIIE domain-containing protein n=1 Tax=Streptomyces sp. HNM0574 TaxID=2714954 RepID=UPI00146E516D|nr:FtsK/SpoIIIE domain-containing protein [Streptomyces sp. HNM0574]NLU67378.1 FHA domain-containing protein [Streptomyces sp. HNM0574]
MQIRLTVALESRGGRRPGGGAEGVCDVLVTAPAGTMLAAVTSALASAAASAAAAAPEKHGDGGAEASREHAHESVAVYAGTERLDPHRTMIGEPPLLDGSVIALHGPAAPVTVPAYGPALARLHVVAGPDAGGVHLLQGGNVRLGRSADADVPLDDPDVSRLHCAVTVGDSGAVTVTDLGSTNGTTLDGVPVGGRPVLFRPGATLAVGESALRLELPAVTGESDGGEPLTLATVPDGNGRLRLAPHPAQDGPHRNPHEQPYAAAPSAPAQPVSAPHFPAAPVGHPGTGPAPWDDGTHGAGVAPRRPAEPAAGPGADAERRRGRGLGAWARRITGAAREEEAGAPPYGADGGHAPAPQPAPGAHGHTAHPDERAPGTDAWGSGAPAAGQRLPDPSSVLLTALGPGPRLWERGPGHPDALTLRLGTAHQGAGRPGDPVTVGLRDAGALGLAGPRDRLTGLARWVLAQLTALHGPSTLDVVLLAADRSRSVRERAAEWSWLGWLPHLRPAHGQDCRLLTAYDSDQAAARTAELTRRLEEERRAGPARAPGAPHPGPYTLLVVDGDPGHAAVREAVARLTAEGPAAGIHVLCLAETPPATPASPLTETTRAAYAASPAFRSCGVLGVLSGAVATAVRVVRQEAHPPGARAAAPGTAVATPAAGGGTVATVDGVSAAWAERFARALAPLRETESAENSEAGAAGSASRPVVTLPRTARLLDELGLARATPAALLARWSEPDSAEPGRASLVFGAGPRGPLEAELASAPGAPRHALVTGPAGTGKTELLRSLAASLAAGERPDRLRLLLVDGDGGAPREGLRVCGELPHVSGHLAADDPVVMREFAQSLSAELKRRAELLGEDGTYEEHVRRGARPAPRVVPPRSSPEAVRGAGAEEGAADLEPDATRGTLRLRPGRDGAAARPGEAARAALPRLVVLVDDFDTLVDPALGNPGRPAAGSVVRALEAVARHGARLGVHLVAATGRPDRTAETGVSRTAGAELRVELTGEAQEGEADGEGLVPGRGLLTTADGGTTAFQAGRVTGRIPRTSTLRPTVVPLEGARAGDPPERRPVRELGNGPTDLALLASAIGRAAQSAGAVPPRASAAEPSAQTASAAPGAGSGARSRSGQEGALDS